MVIDGNKIASDLLAKIAIEVKELNFTPIFCDILVGNDPVSAQYVKMKAKTAESVGISFRKACFSDTISTELLTQEIKNICSEKNLCGLIIQLPLPKSIDTQTVLDAVTPDLDVDCIGSINSNEFYQNKNFLSFPTVDAIMEIIESSNIDLFSKNILILGKGKLVGAPLAHIFKSKNIEFENVDKNTLNVSEKIKKADLIISAIGVAGFIKGEMLKPGVCVIDAGTSELEGGVFGDVEFESVKNVASVISPVPKGVGPITVAKLLFNVLKVAKTKKQ